MRKLSVQAQFAGLLLLTMTACGGSSSSSGGGAVPPSQFTTTTANAFTDFSPAVGSNNFPGPQSALTSAFVPNALFVGYNTGFDAALYKLDVSTTNVFRTNGTPVILPGSSGKSVISNINFVNSDNAYICASDNLTGNNSIIYLFNPSTINDSNDLRPIDLSAGNLLQITPLPGAVDSDGQAVTAPYNANFPVGAAAFEINGVVKLFVGFSNTQSFPVVNPGALVVYDLDLTTSPIGVTQSTTIFTTRFNPSSMSVFDNGQGQGPLLYVTCDGGSMANFTELTGSVEVFNPTTMTSVTNVDLGITNPVGKVIVNDQGTRGYIGTNPQGGMVRVHEINVTNNTFIQTFGTTESSVGSNFSNPVAVSANGNFVYQQLQGDRRVVIYNRNTGQLVDNVSTPVPSPRSTVAFTDTPNYMARRPGDSGSVLFSIVSLQGGNAALDAIIPTFR